MNECEGPSLCGPGNDANKCIGGIVGTLNDPIRNKRFKVCMKHFNLLKKQDGEELRIIDGVLKMTTKSQRRKLKL